MLYFCLNHYFCLVFCSKMWFCEVPSFINCFFFFEKLVVTLVKDMISSNDDPPNSIDTLTKGVTPDENNSNNNDNSNLIDILNTSNEERITRKDGHRWGFLNGQIFHFYNLYIRNSQLFQKFWSLDSILPTLFFMILKYISLSNFYKEPIKVGKIIHTIC